jgi:hypothetical protein
MSQKADFIHKEVPVKRQKIEDTKVDIPSSIVAHFTTQEGARTGPPIEIPVTSTTKQLETLINALLENAESVGVLILYIVISILKHHIPLSV